jgi:hypothetical protein
MSPSGGVTIFNTLTMLKRLVDGQWFSSQQLQPDVAEYCLYHRVDAYDYVWAWLATLSRCSKSAWGFPYYCTSRRRLRTLVRKRAPWLFATLLAHWSFLVAPSLITARVKSRARIDWNCKTRNRQLCQREKLHYICYLLLMPIDVAKKNFSLRLVFL